MDTAEKRQILAENHFRAMKWLREREDELARQGFSPEQIASDEKVKFFIQETKETRAAFGKSLATE